MNAKKKKWMKIKKKKNNKINFIHIPKTGGSFVKAVIQNTDITRPINYHGVKKQKNGINFSVIRHPVDRFESYLNFRKEMLVRRYFKNKNKNKNIQLNDIVAKMTDKDILNPGGGGAFKTLSYYAKGIDIFITIDKLENFLTFFDKQVDTSAFEKKNVSTKTSGRLDKKTRNRLKTVLKADMEIYKKLKSKKLI